MNKYDAVIIGGGACGLMCAVQAGFLGKRVLILEKKQCFRRKNSYFWYHPQNQKCKKTHPKSEENSSKRPLSLTNKKG